MKRKIALALASGGARGYAHIGIIEEFVRQGFEISSVSGTSMGALIGGIYVSGKLEDFKEWALGVDRAKMFSLMDFTLSKRGFVKGDKLIKEMQQIVPDVNIENCKIPFTAVATDIKNGKEVVFSKGSLYEAIRSSISLPSFFTPYEIDDKILVDGGIVNPLPLNRVYRNTGDILVGVDISAPAEMLPKEGRSGLPVKSEKKEDPGFFERLRGQNAVIDSLIDKRDELNETLISRIRESYPNLDKHILAIRRRARVKKLRNENKEKLNLNYYTVLVRASGLMIEKNSELSIKLYKPDILISIPHNSYTTMDFYKAGEIIDCGVSYARKAIEEYKNM